MKDIKGTYEPRDKTPKYNSLEFARVPSVHDTEVYRVVAAKAISDGVINSVDRIYSDGHCLVTYNTDETCIVASLTDFRNIVRGWLLTNPYFVPVEALANVLCVSDIHRQSAFYLRLLEKGLEKKEIEMFLLALNISVNMDYSLSKMADSSDAFWKTIYELDSIGMYGKCVTALFELDEQDIWFDDLIDTLISWGQDLLCEMEGGLFRSVVYEPTGDWFYVYEVQVGSLGNNKNT